MDQGLSVYNPPKSLSWKKLRAYGLDKESDWFQINLGYYEVKIDDELITKLFAAGFDPDILARIVLDGESYDKFQDSNLELEGRYNRVEREHKQLTDKKLRKYDWPLLFGIPLVAMPALAVVNSESWFPGWAANLPGFVPTLLVIAPLLIGFLIYWIFCIPRINTIVATHKPYTSELNGLGEAQRLLLVTTWEAASKQRVEQV